MDNDAMQLLGLKQQVIKHLEANYKAFIDSLRGIPAVGDQLKIALTYLDTGLLWLKESINNLPLAAIAPQPRQPAAEEGLSQAAEENMSLCQEPVNSEQPAAAPEAA